MTGREDGNDEDARPDEPPVDGPGASEGNDEAGATSYDEPGGHEHGT
jgi:hypothetical protein